MCRFSIGSSDGKTYLVQRVQKESTILWTNSTLYLGFLVCLNGPCGKVDDALQINISLGQRYEPSSGSLGIRPIGRWLTKFETSTRHACSSSGISTCSPIAFFKLILQLFTKASAQPFWRDLPQRILVTSRCPIPQPFSAALVLHQLTESHCRWSSTRGLWQKLLISLIPLGFNAHAFITNLLMHRVFS